MRNAFSVFFSILLLGLPCAGHAQLFESAHVARGGGTWQGCNTSMEVEFNDTIVDYLTYRFDPQIVPGSTVMLGSVWSYYDGTFEQELTDTLTHLFPTPGEHFVCLTANAYDLTTQQPCSTTTCRSVEIYQDSSCEDLVVDFTIQSVDGQMITFTDLSSFPAGIQTANWNFGNGASSVDLQPVQNFTDEGPFQICLTVVANGAAGCTATICKWLYLGPAPVDCDVLLDPGFLFLQQGALVGVLDTSTTTGMFNSIEWDFGDGASASGQWAIHGYDENGTYSLCSTIRLWGPLAADTCVTTQCIPVAVFEAVGMGEITAPRDPILAYPVPFKDLIMLSGLAMGPLELQVVDARGRIVHTMKTGSMGSALLDLGHLESGGYVVRCFQGDGSQSVRIWKE